MNVSENNGRRLQNELSNMPKVSWQLGSPLSLAVMAPIDGYLFFAGWPVLKKVFLTSPFATSSTRIHTPIMQGGLAPFLADGAILVTHENNSSSNLRILKPGAVTDPSRPTCRCAYLFVIGPVNPSGEHLNGSIFRFEAEYS